MQILINERKILMKKFVLLLISVATSLLLCSCVSSSSAPQAAAKLTTDILTGNVIENMTAEAATGTYSLKEVAGLAGLSAAGYTQNTITLSEDGSFELVSEYGKEKTTHSCTYTVSSNGIISLSDKDLYLVAPGEKIVCNGAFIQVEGKMGAVSPKMLYEKNKPAESEPVKDNTDDTQE